MSEPTSVPGTQVNCVASLLEHLSTAAHRFAAGEPLGPYLVDALLEDVDLCPALQQPESRKEYDALHSAIGRARRSVNVAIACTSTDRDWAAKELRAAVTHAQECLEKWRDSVIARKGGSEADVVAEELGRIGTRRCPSCAFVHAPPPTGNVADD